MLDSQVIKIIQQWKQAIRDQDTSSGNVQIIEQVVGECKNQLITVAQTGGRKLHLCTDQEEEEIAQKAAIVFEGGMGDNSRPNR